METDPAELAQEAAKRARNAALLAMLALAVAVAVLAIDNGIKKQILGETAKARRLLDEFTTIAREAGSGQEAADDTGAPDSPGVDGGGSVADAAGQPAAADHDAAAGGRAPVRGQDGKFARSRGDG
jgi:hypothetical protein